MNSPLESHQNHLLSKLHSSISRRGALILIFTMVGLALVCVPAAADPKKKKGNCLIVTITNWTLPTAVALEEWVPTPAPGIWVSVANKIIRKLDNSQAEFCSLEQNIESKRPRKAGHPTGWSSSSNPTQTAACPHH